MASYNPKKAIYLLFLLMFFFVPAVSEDQVTFLHQFCSEGRRYVRGSAYQSNLDLLLSNPSNEAISKKFYNSTVGKGVDRVYGLFLCNGAYTAQVCQDCITVAAGQVQQICPNDVEAIVFYGQCMLRYANHSIFSIKDDSSYFSVDYGSIFYKKFDQQVSSMLIDLSNKASSDNSTLAFATGVVYVEEFITLMAYVDCTPDLTSSDCYSCLQVGLSRLPINGKQLGTTVLPSCRLSYTFIDVTPGNTVT